MSQLSRSDMNLAIIQFAICQDIVQQLLKRTYFTEHRLTWSFPIQSWIDVDYPSVRQTDAGNLELVGFRKGLQLQGKVPAPDYVVFAYELHELILMRKYDEFAAQFEEQMKKDILADLRIIEGGAESVMKAFE